MMKKTVKLTALLLASMSSLVWASATEELQARLNKVDTLSADYMQKVSDPKGKEVQQGTGKSRLNARIYFV